MVQGQVLLKEKGEGGGDTFPYSFFQGLSFLHLEITLPFAKLLCIKKIFFFCHRNFIKMLIPSGLEEPENIP